jgi:Flp pilus assembly protein TadG
MNQRGVSESTQWAVLTPVLLMLILGLVQLGVWLHARNVASQAAATVADLQASGSTDSYAAGRRVATNGGLTQISITSDVSQGLTVVTVRGRAPLFFDLGQGQIAESAVLPLEQWR